jgi:hypothetical protein
MKKRFHNDKKINSSMQSRYKNLMSIILGILYFFFLIARQIYLQLKKWEDEKQWYADNLNYDFSAKVDFTVLFNPKGMDTRSVRLSMESGNLSGKIVCDNISKKANPLDSSHA